jgi:hypothetical protein
MSGTLCTFKTTLILQISGGQNNIQWALPVLNMKATELLCKKAKNALFCIYKTLNSDKLNILPNLKLFDSCVKPILLYCSEVLCRNIVER